MLIYHPALDFNHTIFRILQLLHHMKMDKVEIERIQIWDFYYVFPSQIQHNFQFTKETTKLKKIFSLPQNPYEDIQNSQKVFSQMKELQNMAIKSLASKGIISIDSLDQGIVQLIPEKLPKSLVEGLKEVSLSQQNVIKLITSPFNDLPMYGNAGFKRRTGLIEFKYDKH